MLQPQKNLDVFEILAMVQYEQTQWIENYAEDEIKYAAMRAKCLAESDSDIDFFADFDKAFHSLLKNDNED